MNAIVRKDEPLTLQCQWFFHEGEDKWYLTETFPDSDAFLLHLANVATQLGQLLEITEVSRFEVFGTAGRILIDNLHRQPIQVVSSAAQSAVAPGWSFPSPLPGAISDGHVAMLAHFIEALRSGAQTKSEAIVGWNALAVIEAAAASVASGHRENIRTRH